MVGNDGLGERMVAPQDHMTAVLTFEVKPCPLERPNALRSRYPGQCTHTATTSAPNASSGTGSPSSSKATT